MGTMSEVNEPITPSIAKNFLEERFNAWFNKQNHYKENQRAEQLKKAYEYLDYFLQNADFVQEALIELTQLTALKTMMVDGLLVTVDQNRSISSLEELATLLNKTAATLLGEVVSESMTYPLAKKIWPLVQKTQAKPTRQNSRPLREAIEGWALETDIYPSAIQEHSIEVFTESRKAHTQAMNSYQASLIEAEREVKKQLDSFDDTEIMNLENKPEIEAKLKDLLEQQSALNKRLLQVDSFRAGVQKKLEPQDQVISALGVNDIAVPFRSFENCEHPRIMQIENMRSELNKMVMIAPNLYYLEDLPDVKIKESGKKSWESAIRKLYDSKAGLWGEMYDLSRINSIFSNAESMFFFNKALHRVSPSLGWEHNKISRGRDGDKGPRMMDSGTLNWVVCMNYMRAIGRQEPGKELFAEIKSDPLSVSLSEAAGHLLYELARAVYKGQRKIDTNSMNDQKARSELGRKIHDTVELLLLDKSKFSDDVIKNFHAIQRLASEFEVDAEVFKEMHSKIVDTETIIRLESARDTESPTMAAFFKMQYDEMMKNPNYAHKKKKLVILYEKYGPKQGVHFTNYDMKLVTQLYDEYKARMKSQSAAKEGRDNAGGGR